MKRKLAPGSRRGETPFFVLFAYLTAGCGPTTGETARMQRVDAAIADIAAKPKAEPLAIVGPSPASEPPPSGIIATPQGPVHWFRASEHSFATPRITMLHGMGSRPSGTCHTVRGLTDLGASLACPTGNVVYETDLADWSGDGMVRAAHIDAALTSLGTTPARSQMLAGFSRGAFTARDVVVASKGRYRSLLLIGAAITMPVEDFRAHGIERVVLASGEHDAATATMKRGVPKLCQAGIDAVWVSLGPVYHALPADSAERLKSAVGWALGQPSNVVACEGFRT